MDNENSDEQDPLVGDEPTIEKVESDNQDVEIPKPDIAKSTKQKIAALVLVLIAVVVGISIFSADSPEQPSTNEDSTDLSEPKDSITLDSIESQVMQNQSIWEGSLEELLENYDSSNDNVAYTFNANNFLIVSNGLPDHETGDFPNSNNPNAISEQDGEYLIPRAPKYTGTTTDVRVFGISLGGVPLEPGTAEKDPETGWSIEAFNSSNLFNPGVDNNNAHVQPNGTYHYHGLPRVLLTSGEAHSNLIGFAADGFPIYGDHGYRDPTNSDSPIDHMTSSWRLKTGQRAEGEPAGTYNGDYTNDFKYVEEAGDLDECNGRFTVTPEFPNGTYAYFISEQFPFIGRCVKGEVLESFLATPAAGNQARPPAPGGQPPQ